MIRFFFLQNRQGKTRLAKWYVPIDESEKRRIEGEVHRLVTNRDPKFTNFARRSSAEHLIATKALRCTATAWIPHCR